MAPLHLDATMLHKPDHKVAYYEIQVEKKKKERVSGILQLGEHPWRKWRKEEKRSTTVN